MRPLQELRAAAGLLASRPGEALRPEAAAGLAWLPAVGAVAGAAAVLAGRAAGTAGDTAGAVAAVTVLALCFRRLRVATLGAWPPALAVAVEAAAAVAMPGSARTMALLLAPVFACWAMVVQCYGGRTAERDHPWAALVGRARFREFGWASVTTLGGALVALDAVGLAVAILAAVGMLAVRLGAYRARGGMAARDVVATGLVVEATVLVTLAGIARLTA